ncbi:uncharacterized protein N7483_008130 [Penicillium malachiteum]|uniref:uncharacterized protein n=1 Tax=Penicillium malachiteum TaxID=1324776 RepID=UPI002546875C|nr:uncharacterized protein N7483_008130 [Penicillium malachiteum]KAJ5726773.1 hypothetical protein N7483_008130 [Penicillium malachiteum]
MSLGSGLKQATHMALISEQELSPQLGFEIRLRYLIGCPLIPSGSCWDDCLRHWNRDRVAFRITATKFKKDPVNKGKPYGCGLLSLATKINYGAYTLWRGAFALTSGGCAWGLFSFAFFFHHFATRGVPVLDEYCTNKYGKAWSKIKSRVRYQLLPWIY